MLQKMPGVFCLHPDSTSVALCNKDTIKHGLAHLKVRQGLQIIAGAHLAVDLLIVELKLISTLSLDVY
jgi:hypothetical protein